jgi:hypothetical protein
MTKAKTIRGIVIPEAWDEKGEITSVAIVTFNEEKYVVKDTPKGRDLQSLLRSCVKVRGIIENHEQISVIKVDRFQKDISKQ